MKKNFKAHKSSKQNRTISYKKKHNLKNEPKIISFIAGIGLVVKSRLGKRQKEEENKKKIILQEWDQEN